jgi:hypothetical protein
LITQKVFVEEVKAARDYGVSHRQWRLDTTVLGSASCPGEKPGDAFCAGELADPALTGLYTLAAIPDSNLLFVQVRNYQKGEGRISYCGAMTDSCKDVQAPFSSVIRKRNFCADSSKNWLSEQNRQRASVNCRQPAVWGSVISSGAVNSAMGTNSDCPTEELTLLIVTVVVPLISFCVIVVGWLVWNSWNQKYLRIQGTCFPAPQKGASAEADSNKSKAD